MRSLFVLLLLISITGCRKRQEDHVNAVCTDSCTTFNVTVTTDQNAATLLRDAYVELAWSDPIPPKNPGRLIASGTTDASGTVRFVFKAAPEELQHGRFSITARKGSDYIAQDQDYHLRTYDTVVITRIQVPGKATVQMVFKNFNPTSADDIFAASPAYDGFGTSPGGVTMLKPNEQPGNTNFSGQEPPFSRLELIGTTAGNQYTYFYVLIKKKGVRTDRIDSLFIPKGQTGVYEIEY